ncbi:hypothetical protein JXD20_03070 [Candidatus Peregrinibacteria bacterium]|nr:hypothetical protein [Candidatus Peregrinibacteria bacterium]
MRINTAKSFETRDEYDVTPEFGASFTRIEELTRGNESLTFRSLQFASKRAQQRVATFKHNLSGMAPRDFAIYIADLIDRAKEGEMSIELLQERDVLKKLLLAID